jgi:GT2 family glycosyltransferase/peptidoglycan/xylan/chitin deacetylase (PgdA/CDA1 family)
MPQLSVIIATYNRSAPLRACLQALARQTLPASEFEVVVVVDGSTDATEAMLGSLEVPYPLRVIPQPNRGQAAAANRGLDESTGRWCLFLDDDIHAEPGLLAAHLAAQRTHDGVVGLGAIRLVLPSDPDWFAVCYAEEWNGHYVRLEQHGQPSWFDAYGGNLCASRAVLVELGGFATDLAAAYDVELAYRLRERGMRLVYVPEAVASQHETKRGGQLASDFQKRGAVAIELYRRHPAMLAGPLGSFRGRDPRWNLLRRAMLALDLPPALLVRLGMLLPRRSWQRKWAGLIHSHSRWRGIRRSVDRSEWRRLTWATPILMYHAFGGKGETASRYVVPIGRFARQMTWLRWMGYRVISLEELVKCRREWRLPPARSVVITMDDGYADTYSLAMPVLRRHAFPATLFVVTQAVGGRNHWSRGDELEGRALVSWSDLRTLLDGGMGIGAHTRTHPVLPTMSGPQAEEEVIGSRTDLERALGATITMFAYPYGEFDASIEDLVERAGFLGSCGVVEGFNDGATPVQALCRMEVFGTDSLITFALRLLGRRVRRRPRARLVTRTGRTASSADAL